jgi:hypothetical protein
MRFEVSLPNTPGSWQLRAAGVEVPKLFDFWYDVTIKRRRQVPAELAGEYFWAEPPLGVSVTILKFDKHTQLAVDVADGAVGNKIRERLEHYSVENDGDAVAEREHKQLWSAIEKILQRDKLSYDKLQMHQGVLTRRAIEALMQLCEGIDPVRQDNIHSLFIPQWLPKSEYAFTAEWLIGRFEAERDPNEQIGMRLWDLAVPAVADDLIRLLEDRRFRARRGPLALALAKTKDPRAADVIASVLDEDGVTRWALEALGKARNGATKHVEAIRQQLRHRDNDVRREAKKTLKKLGFPADAPPPPVHLVKNRKTIPKGLEEWSQNLDMDDLVPTLQRLTKCVDAGFGETEIAEVAAVAEEMEPEQTKAFRFPVVMKRQKHDVWMVIFMDDVDAPDLAIHSDGAIIRKFDELSLEL